MGGFFGSGKTTVMSRLTEAMLEKGEKICIVENEVGENAVDDLLIRKGGIEISTILGGCVCCQITGSLIEALHRIKAEIDPDWVLVELTGIALLTPLRDTIQAYSDGEDPIVTASVIDAARWHKLLKAAAPIMTQQVEGGDIIVINKIDLNPQLEPIAADVKVIAGDRRILPMEATRNSGHKLQELLEQEVARNA